MYRAEDIQARLRQRPFIPLRIRVSEGQQFDVIHPDLVFVGVRDITIGFPAANNPTIYDQVTRVALVHVVALEDIPGTTSAGNGQQ